MESLSSYKLSKLEGKQNLRRRTRRGKRKEGVRKGEEKGKGKD